jgi:hypothetical protein
MGEGAKNTGLKAVEVAHHCECCGHIHCLKHCECAGVAEIEIPYAEQLAIARVEWASLGVRV